MAIDPNLPPHDASYSRTGSSGTGSSGTGNSGTGSSGIGKTLLILAAVALLVLVVLFATGMLNMNTSGELRAPEVAVSGGEVPDVDVQAADVNVATKSVTVEVPEITVDKPGDAPAR